METLIGAVWPIIEKAGVPGVLLFLVIAMMTGLLVPKAVVDEIRKDRDFWRDLARLDRGLAHRSADLVGQSTAITEQAAAIAAKLLADRDRKPDSA